MKWHAQVLHVAAKDWRLAWWLIAGFALFLGVNAMLAETADSYWVFLPLLLLFMALMLIGHIAQFDPPGRSGAFWLTRPIARTAVWAAKLLTLAALVALAVAAVILTLWPYDLRAGDVAILAAESSLWFSAFLSSGLLVAAMTRDTKEFLLGLVLLALSLIAIDVALAKVAPPEITLAGRSHPFWLNDALFLAGSAAITAYQYTTRRTRHSIAFTTALLLTTATLAKGETVLGSSRTPANAAVADSIKATGEMVSKSTFPGRPMVGIALSGGRDGYLYVFNGSRVVWRTPGGIVDTTRAAGGFTAQRGKPAVRGAVWAGVEPGDRGSSRMLHDLPAAPRAGAEPIALLGSVTVSKAEPVIVMPLSVGEKATVSGMQVKIHEVRMTGAATSVKLMVARVNTAPSRRAVWMEDSEKINFAVLDRENSSLQPLRPITSHGTSFGLLLNSPRFWRSTLQLSTQSGAFAPAPPPSEPASTNLALIAFDWQFVGSYPLSVPIRQ